MMKQPYGVLIAATILMEPLMTAAADAPVEDVDAEPAQEQGLDQLESITVLGRKPMVENRSATIGALGNKDAMAVPLAISSYGSVLIQNQQLTTLTEIAKTDPSVQDAAVNSSYSNISIRGFTIDWTNSLKRNNLPLAPYQDVPMEAIEQVAIIKGPSGFLYGLTPPGGTVNYITKRPTLYSFTSLSIGGGSFDGRFATLDTSHKLRDDVGVRINVGHEQQGDNYDRKDDHVRTFVAGAVDWVVNDKSIFQLNGDYQHKKVAANAPLGTRNNAIPPLFSPRTLIGLPWLNYEADVFNVNPRFDYEITSNWTVTVNAAYSSITRYTAFPGVGSVNPVTGDIIQNDAQTRIRISPDQTYRVLAGEGFVSGKFDTGSISHDLVVGVSGTRYRAREAGYFIIQGLPIGSLFNPDYSFPEPVLPSSLPAKTHNDVNQYGPFFSDTIQLTKGWEMLLGGRYVIFENRQSLGAATLATFDRKKFVPNVGMIFRPTDEVMLYANFTRALEQSNVAPPSANNAGQQFGPLESTAYELGMKSTLSDSVNATVAVFQIEKSLEFIDLTNVFRQDGEQRHRGVEVAVNGELFRGLRFIAGGTRLWTTQLNLADVRVLGKRTPNVPKFQANLYLDYDVAAVEGLSLTASVYHNSDKAVNAANTLIIPGFTAADVGARFSHRLGDRLIIYRATVQNVTDEVYWAAAQSAQLMISQPRAFKLSAQIEF